VDSTGLAEAVIALGVLTGVTQHQLQQANSRNQAVAAAASG
jgi:hypothetical protein